jgi:pentatricopeptide repeat protein
VAQRLAPTRLPTLQRLVSERPCVRTFSARVIGFSHLELFLNTGACGRAGQASKALELFETMKSEGLAADRVAFNALFSALRVAKNSDKVCL